MCDLAQRRIIDLLPDREPATIEAWLKAHPEIAVVSRDRGGGYGQAAANAAPQAVQVADRWHLMENASAAFLEAVRRSMRSIREALNATVINPALLTCAERIQYDGFLLRQDSNRTIKALAAAGVSIKRSRGRRAAAASWCAACCVAATAMCSVAGAASWNRSSSDSGPSGRTGVATAPSYGADFASLVSAEASGSWRSGRPGGDATRKPA